MSASPLILASFNPKKRKIDFNNEKCAICQEESSEKLRNASCTGLKTFLGALKKRNDAGFCIPYERLKSCMILNDDNEIEFIEPVPELFWHKTCYSSFTSVTNIAALKPLPTSKDQPPAARGRVTRETFNFKELCFFCGKRSYKKDRKLINVSSYEFQNTLQGRVKDDICMLRRIGGNCSKLIALGAKYHKNCHANYIKVSVQCNQDPYDAAFNNLVEKIKPEIENGRALAMDALHSQYQEFLKQYVSLNKAQMYQRQKLKARLLSKCPFLRILPMEGNKADLVVSRSLRFQDTINTVANMKSMLRDVQATADMSMSRSNGLISQDVILNLAAASLRSTLRSTEGIPHLPLNPADVSIEQEEALVPNDIYTFLYRILASNPAKSPDDVEKSQVKGQNEVLHRQILSIGQDMMYHASSGQCKTPKHIGLGISLHQMTQSKEVVSLINKQGHCISYDEVLKIDTCWAEEQLKSGIGLTSNMIPGKLIRAAGDNFNRAVESLDGTHHDVVNMVLYQEHGLDDTVNGGHFGTLPEERNRKSKTLKDGQGFISLLQCPNLGGKQPNPRHLIGKVKTEWFLTCTEQHSQMRALDQELVLLRNAPSKFFLADITQETSQAIPGWTVFHAVVTSKVDIAKTNIGYCPMIPATATDFNTVYTMMRYFQDAFSALGQDWTFVVYDEAIYCKAQMIKWRNPDEFARDYFQMGGMHRAINFMGNIGSVMQESGFEDVLIEADIYGASVISHALKGKAYNRGVRIHKLMNEAMNRLKWIAFVDSGGLANLQEEAKQRIVEAAKRCDKVFSDIKAAHGDRREEANQAVSQFAECAQPLHRLMEEYVEKGKRCSDTFTFWENYTADFSQLLLDFIGAKRDDKKEIELETFAEMTPLDFQCGHTNYARWGCMNIAEARHLEEDLPEVYNALSHGQGAVYRTARPFSGVWHDMGLEQSINKDCGKYQHLCTRQAALSKYYLTAHIKAAVKAKTQEMSGMKRPASQVHREGTGRRMSEDEDAVKRIVDVVEEKMTNPFVIEEGANAENKQVLMNIATSSVAPHDVTKSLCFIRDDGTKEMVNFVTERLVKNEKDLFHPIKRERLKSFASLNKPFRSKAEQKAQAIDIDRQIFGKLTIIGQAREVNMQELLTYELAPVPLALFNLDGTLRKNRKSDTYSWLEGDLATADLPPPAHADEPTLAVIDLMMLLRMVCTDTADCKTFGELSQSLFNTVLGLHSKYTAIVGDNYSNTESIKAGERARRGSVKMQEIRNPTVNTPLPKQRTKMLSNPKNKANLANFLLSDWIIKGEQRLGVGCQLYLSGGFHDMKYAVKVENGHHVEVPELASDHEEADSRMFLNIAFAKQELGVKRVILWSLDSDVAAMCPLYFITLGLEEFYFKTGKEHKKRYIPIHSVVDELGNDVCMMLPIIHAASGSDSTSSFCGLGKKKWLKAINDHPELVDKLMDLGSDATCVSDGTGLAFTSLLSKMYCGNVRESLDVVRYELFSKKNKRNEKLPPTMDAFTLHLKRANFQSYIWLHATTPFLHLNPLGNGWILDGEGHMVPNRMRQPSAPDAVLTFKKCGCKRMCQTRNCRCFKEGLVCTDACGCDTDICLNRDLNISDS